jgi:hypothetical protein
MRAAVRDDYVVISVNCAEPPSVRSGDALASWPRPR